MIEGAHVDVVDVEQDQTVGFGGDGGEKFPLGHHGRPISEIARHILQKNPPAEKILDLPNPRDHVAQGFLGVGQR